MAWQDQLCGDPLSWLLEPGDPGVRYLALRDLVDPPSEDDTLRKARKAAHQQGPIPAILSEMNRAGYWVEAGPGYNPKYRSTVWSIIMLAQLGALAEEDERIGRACSYVLDHALTDGGQFTTAGGGSGTADCLQGNLCWALLEMGCDDPRLEKAFDWMARTVTGEGISPASDRKAAVRFYAGKCGPGFACGANNKLACAWGATKVMLALGRWPEHRRTRLIKQAIRVGTEFLLSVDPAEAAYPTGYTSRPSGNWWKFGFPVFYVTDLLQILEAMMALGKLADPRLHQVLKIVREKQSADGPWLLEYDYTGKTWLDWGLRGRPNKWVTWRALRVLKAAGR